MPYSLKGFVKLNPKINNAVGVISQIGELSTYTQTFTREMAEFSDSRFPFVTFVSFSSLSENNDNVAVTRNYYEHVLDLTQKLYDYCSTFTGLMNKLDVLNFIQTSFFGSVSNLNCGDIVNAEGISMPEWLSWSNFTLPSNSIKIWFSDNAMQRQYDNYSIIIVPPIDNIDSFFASSAELKAAIAQRTNSKTAELIQIAKQRKPETIIRVDDFVYTNVRTPEYAPTVSWSSIIYGSNGNSVDNIKNAIRAYCEYNSSYPISKWTELFPDIFKSTEFTIVPLWWNVAIPNKVLQTGIYSPTLSPNREITDLVNRYSFISSAHLFENIQILGVNFKSLNLAIFGGVDNKNSQFKISNYFPDYINVATTSVDFSRMSSTTQKWLYMITELLIIAEDPNAVTSLPAGVQKISRFGTEYIAKAFNGVQYLVATKPNFV